MKEKKPFRKQMTALCEFRTVMVSIWIISDKSANQIGRADRIFSAALKTEPLSFTLVRV